MDQPGIVASMARGQPNSVNTFFPVPVRVRGVGLGSRIRPSRSASARSLYTSGLDLALNHGLIILWYLSIDLLPRCVGTIG